MQRGSLNAVRMERGGFSNSAACAAEKRQMLPGADMSWLIVRCVCARVCECVCLALEHEVMFL